MMIWGCGESKPKQWSNVKSMAEKLDHPNAFATDEKFIYFITGGTVASQQEGTNNVMKMPVSGGAPTILFKGGDIIPDAEAIALDETYAYFSANGLRKIAKEGGESVLLTKAFIIWEIALDKENVYWMPYVGEGMQPAPIYSVSKNGGTPKAITDPRPSANGLCVDGDFVYWVQTDGIYKTTKQGGQIDKIYNTPGGGGQITSDLKSDAQNFYFLQGSSERDLMKLPKSGGDAKKIAEKVSKFWTGEDIIVFQRYITSFDVAIYKIGKDGGGETELDKNGYISDLIVGKNKIYLSDIVNIYELNK